MLFLGQWCVSSCFRGLVKGVDTDVLLALDYIISMQYFRLFRWDATGQAQTALQLQLVGESQKLLWQTPQATEEFLRGLKTVAENVQPGGSLYKAACAMLKSPIRSAFKAVAAFEAAAEGGQETFSPTEHWLFEEYQKLQIEQKLPEWPKAYSMHEDGTWDEFGKSALKVWLHCKMRGEKDSYMLGRHSGDHDRQFTETDRLVKSLLQTEVFSGEDSNNELTGKPGRF